LFALASCVKTGTRHKPVGNWEEIMQQDRQASLLSRRDVIASAVALGGASVLTHGGVALAQQAARRIDLHHHFFPPAFLEAQRKAAARQNRPAVLGEAVATWTQARTLEAMDRNRIATAMLTLSTGGPWFGDVADAVRLARECNDYAAGMMRDHPGRFGLFASLPMPDPSAALREINYAFDTLKADGVEMMSSYATANGVTWPGDESLAPVFAELNRRKAVVFFHLGRGGSSQLCCGNVIPGVPDVMVETPHDMTRAIMSLLFTGTLSRNPDIRFIFSNAGGTVPALAGRIAVTSKRLGADFDKLVPKGVEYELKRLYYEVSNGSTPTSLAALAALVPTSQIVFGTDYPFVPIENTAGGVEAFWPDPARDVVFRANATKLLPRLA
jgi:6-methylsalicylate decarboxylase